MIRPAKPSDTMRLVDMLEEQQARSRYAGIVNVDRDYARKIVAAAIQRNGGIYSGSACVLVDEVDDTVEAFIIGVLDRVYSIGDRLSAKDMFLVATDRAGALATMRLLGGYIAWASHNPNVYEIELSHTDALPEGERMGAIYERMGFVRGGTMYRRTNDAGEARAAA